MTMEPWTGRSITGSGRRLPLIRKPALPSMLSISVIIWVPSAGLSEKRWETRVKNSLRSVKQTQFSAQNDLFLHCQHVLSYVFLHCVILGVQQWDFLHWGRNCQWILHSGGHSIPNQVPLQKQQPGQPLQYIPDLTHTNPVFFFLFVLGRLYRVYGKKNIRLESVPLKASSLDPRWA